jgi:pyruvate dehydrogenase E1 component alpha subunit
MRVWDVYEAARRAAEVCRSHQQPVLLVCNTYRFVGHYQKDILRYRPEEEAEEMFRLNDPIHLAEHELLDECAVYPDELVEIRDRVRAEIDAAAEAAKQSEYPPVEWAMEDVYVERS